MLRKIFYILALMLCPLIFKAQNIEDLLHLPIKGSTRTWVGIGNGQYNFPAAMAEIGLKANFGNKSYNAVFDLRLRSGYQFNEFNTVFDAREAYIGYNSKSFNFSLGKKIVDWSRVDYNSVVNPILPTNVFFISTEPDDMKISQLMLHVGVELVDRLKWQTVIIPFYTPSVYRFDLFDLSNLGDFSNFSDLSNLPGLDSLPGIGNLPNINDWFNLDSMPWLNNIPGIGNLLGNGNNPNIPKLNTTPEVSFIDGVMPQRKFINASIATKVTADFNFGSFGLTGFRGYSTGYGFSLSKINYLSMPWQILMAPMYYKQTMFGFDAEIPALGNVFKLEIAYNHIHDSVCEVPTELTTLFSADKNLTHLLKQMPYPIDGYHGNFAIERLFGSFAVVLQYTAHYAPEFKELPKPTTSIQEPIYKPFLMMADFNRMIFYQKEKYTHGLSLMLSKNFLYDALHTDIAVGYTLNTKEWMIRPSVSYAINDNLSTSIGAFILYGPKETLNSYASNILNSVFFQFKATF